MGLKNLPKGVQDWIEREGVETGRVKLPGEATEGAWMPLPEGCTEAVFLERIIQYAQAHGWIVAHFRPARVKRGGKEIYETPVQADGKGFPDLLMLRKGQLVVIEAKKNDKLKPSAEQKRWLGEFQKVPACVVFVGTPENWPAIQKVLA